MRDIVRSRAQVIVGYSSEWFHEFYEIAGLTRHQGVQEAHEAPKFIKSR
jgi:hypothetical protein